MPWCTHHTYVAAGLLHNTNNHSRYHPIINHVLQIILGVTFIPFMEFVKFQIVLLNTSSRTDILTHSHYLHVPPQNCCFTYTGLEFDGGAWCRLIIWHLGWLIIWRTLKSILFKLCQSKTGMTSLFEGTCPTCR